jgi:hypothetical protein
VHFVSADKDRSSVFKVKSVVVEVDTLKFMGPFLYMLQICTGLAFGTRNKSIFIEFTIQLANSTLSTTRTALYLQKIYTHSQFLDLPVTTCSIRNCTPVNHVPRGSGLCRARALTCPY